MNITEVYGIEDDDILTQDIFAFEQTGVRTARSTARLQPTGVRPTFMDQFAQGRHRRCRPASSGSRPRTRRSRPGSLHEGPLGRGRFERRTRRADFAARLRQGGQRRRAWSTSRPSGRSIRTAGRSSAAAIKDQARQCLENLKAKLEARGTSIDKVVWANWSLRDPTEFEPVQRGMGQGLPGRRAGRSVDADDAAPAPSRLPRLDRRHRRGVGSGPQSARGNVMAPDAAPRRRVDTRGTGSGRLGSMAPPPYVLRRSARSRRLRITIDPEHGLVVTVPLATRRGWAHPERLIDAFLREREPWIRRHLDRQAHQRASSRPGAVSPMVPSIRYLGGLHRLRVRQRRGVGGPRWPGRRSAVPSSVRPLLARDRPGGPRPRDVVP